MKNDLARAFRKFAARLMDARACIQSFGQMADPPGEVLLLALDQLQGVTWRLYCQVRRVRSIIRRLRECSGDN